MNKKIFKLISIISTVLLVASIAVSCVASQNMHHIKTCCKEECAFCNIIQIAQDFIEEVFAISIGVTQILLIYYILCKIYNYYFIAVPESLVFQNVQLNE